MQYNLGFPPISIPWLNLTLHHLRVVWNHHQTQMQFVQINIVNQNSLNTKEIIWSFYRASRNIRDKDKQPILAELKY